MHVFPHPKCDWFCFWIELVTILSQVYGNAGDIANPSLPTFPIDHLDNTRRLWCHNCRKCLNLLNRHWLLPDTRVQVCKWDFHSYRVSFIRWVGRWHEGLASTTHSSRKPLDENLGACRIILLQKKNSSDSWYNFQRYAWHFRSRDVNWLFNSPTAVLFLCFVVSVCYAPCLVYIQLVTREL